MIIYYYHDVLRLDNIWFLFKTAFPLASVFDYPCDNYEKKCSLRRYVYNIIAL